MTNSDRLQEIRERAEAATPGPWVETLSDSGGIGLDIARVHPRRIYKAGYYGPLNEPAHDAEFIATSREDIPWLLQLVTEQQREIDRYRRALEAVNEFAKEDDICTHKTIGAQHGWGACFVCLIQATAQGALRGENGFFGEDE